MKGGFTGVTKNSYDKIWQFDAETGQWKEFGTLLQHKRRYHGASAGKYIS